MVSLCEIDHHLQSKADPWKYPGWVFREPQQNVKKALKISVLFYEEWRIDSSDW